MAEIIEEGNIADEKTITGTCGRNMRYLQQDRTLYISGEGEIDPYAFYDDQSFDCVVIEEGCTGIGEYAFYNCQQVKRVALPYGLNIIGRSAFEGCTDLRIHIPENVIIGEDALLRVKWLGKGDPVVCCLEKGVLNIHCQGSLADLPQYDVADVVIHEGCTKISDHAFKNWTNLETVYTPASLEKIDHYAFDGCKRVQLKMRDARILWGGGHGVDLTGVHSFDTSYKLPYKVEGDTLYLGETGEKSFYVIQTEYAGIYDMNWMRPETWDLYETYPWPLRIHKTIHRIVIAPGCKKIGECRFRWFENVELIEIPWGVEEIEEYAFAFCCKLKKLEIPDSVTVIGHNAFKMVPHIIYHGPAHSDDNWGALSCNIHEKT